MMLAPPSGEKKPLVAKLLRQLKMTSPTSSSPESWSNSFVIVYEYGKYGAEALP
jgi:hypothetical protein